MIRKKRGLGRLAALAASGATILGGLFVTSGTAYAVTNYSSSAWTASSTPAAPPIFPGTTNQAAGNWTFTITNDFTTGESYTVDIGPDGTHLQCQSGTDYVSFAGVPKVSSPAPEVTNTGTTDTAPNISVTTAENPTDGAGCTAAGVKDQLIVTVNNTATGTAGDKYDVTVSGVNYNVGAATPAGAGGTAIGAAGSDLPGNTGATAQAFTVGSNATLQPLSIVSNTPPVGIVPGTSHAISNITLKEALFNTVNGSPVTVALPSGDNFTSTVTITVTAGNATVCNSASCTSGASSTTVAPASTPTNTLSFYVKSASSTPSTFVISGMTIAVSSGESTGGQTATITYDTSSHQLQTTAFAVISFTRTAGFTADDTAAASFQSAFPDTDGDGMHKYFNPGTTCANNESGNTNIVLVADFTPFDALSANYLAAWAGTGVVITPYSSLSSAAANIIRTYGVGTVYIVGGTAAVSQAVQSALQSTQAYCPGGTIPDSGPSGAVMLNVVRVAGQTAADTSGLVAQYPGASHVGCEDGTPAAYPNGYNTTSGHSSATGLASSTCWTTAIVATDFTFQDSLGAGPLSYADGLPVVLTDQSGLSNSAAAALVNLGIQQVILLGGPGAISDAVVTSIQNLGITVLRVGGLTYSETSTQLAGYEFNNQNTASPTVSNGLDEGFPSAVGSSRGDDYPDALTSAAALVKAGQNEDSDFNPLVLTQNTSTVGASVDQFLNAAGSAAGIGSNGVNIFSLQVFGGTLAQTPALVQQELNDIAQG